MVCCFFGHRDTRSNIEQELLPIVENLIEEGVDTFLIGHQGGFDYAALHVLKELKKIYPHIVYTVVLAYMLGKKEDYSLYSPEETMYPEGLEAVPRRFAIDWRNNWLVNEADVIVSHITHIWGGAYKFVQKALKKGKRIVNIA